MSIHVSSRLRFSVRFLFCALLILISVHGPVNAKRGCSAFGHSCFGGHGKRFDSQTRGNVIQQNEVISDDNQETEVVHLERKFSYPNQRIASQNEMLFPQMRRQDSSRIGSYKLSSIVRQWLSSHQLPSQMNEKFNDK